MATARRKAVKKTGLLDGLRKQDPEQQRIPEGVHRGKRVEELNDPTLAAMISGWNGGELRHHPFFATLQAAAAARGISPKKEERKTILDEMAMAFAGVILEDYLIDEEPDHMTEADWRLIASEAYNGAEALMREKAKRAGGIE